MNSTRQLALHQQASPDQRGFSLIEILVGLVIGLLATLVIMQVFAVFEGQKRTTTGAADAQTNGSIAIYSIQHELKMAGFGLLPTATASPLDCTTIAFGGTGITSIAPAVITDGGAGPGASDTITIHYGNSNSGGIPAQIGALPGGNAADIGNNFGCHVGDVALLINGASCNLTSVVGPTDIATPAIPSSPANNTTVTLNNMAGANIGANLACLGAWVTSIFRVHLNYDPTGATGAANSQAYLEKATDPLVAGSPIVSDIVNIQAQYGISATAGSNQVTNWVDATGATWASPSVPNRNRIKAMHIAVVTRDGLYEKGIVTSTCTTTKGTVNNGPCAWDDTNLDQAPKIDLSNDPNWQHYRYRVFDSIVPLRNMIWARGSL